MIGLIPNESRSPSGTDNIHLLAWSEQSLHRRITCTKIPSYLNLTGDEEEIFCYEKGNVR